jgi:O-antigen/teichoic acid export membrane protein
LLFPPRYPVAVVATGTMLWIVVAAVRLVRAPESAFLQASGAFKPLARASMMSCGVSIVAVVALLVTLGPVWSIGGIFAGELVFAAGTWIAARRRARELAADEGKRYAAGDREGAMT